MKGTLVNVKQFLHKAMDIWEFVMHLRKHIQEK